MGRRGFTVLETVLAATLASVVVLGCMGAFFAIERTDRTLAARFEEANDLARIQKTMERAFATLLVAETSPDDELAAAAEAAAAAEEQGAEGETQPPPDEEVEGADETEEVPQMARIVLEPDTDPTLTSMIRRARYAAGGGGTSVAAPQRLEVVLSAVPIRPPSVQSTAWANALVGVDDLDDELAADAAGLEDYGGVRGAFVLRPDEVTGRQARRRAASGDERTGWTLWWQPLDGRSEPARVASGLAACSWQMFFDREMHPQLTAYDADQIPTYVQVEIETLTGLYANYLFEVVWTVDTPEEEVQTSGGGAGGDNNGQGGAGGNGGANGAGNGNGGGRRGDGQTARDNGARPRGMTPQGSGPARGVPGRPAPTRQPPPGGRPGGGG